MLRNNDAGARFSRPITKIAVASIALGVCAMILSVSIVKGFQYEIRDKVIGFGSHIQINHRTINNSYESLPVDIAPDFINEVKKIPEVKHVQPYASKPAILQVVRKTEDTTKINDNEIVGVVCKGINKDFDWTFFQNKIVEGTQLNFDSKNTKNDILLSKIIASKLKVSVNDSIYLFMVVADGPKPQKFFVKGIYDSGLADFDEQFVLIDMYHIQRINDWGVQAFAGLKLKNDTLRVEATVNGSNEHRLFIWNNGFPTDKDYFNLPVTSQKLSYIVVDNKLDADQREWIPKFPADTCWLNIEVAAANHKSESELRYPYSEQINDSVIEYYYENYTLTLTQRNSGGSFRYSAGGFEVLLDSWKNLIRADEILTDEIPYDYETRPITALYPEIFDWLELLDTNVKVIILLMLLVCLVNMASTLLVIILERTAMIGTLKAIGTSNASIGKIFIYNAAYYIFVGLIIGNLLAVALAILQQTTGIIQLDPATYFMDTVPVHLDWFYILAIDLGTLLICTFAMLLPSMLIVKISPVKAIRFK